MRVTQSSAPERKEKKKTVDFPLHIITGRAGEKGGEKRGGAGYYRQFEHLSPLSFIYKGGGGGGGGSAGKKKKRGEGGKKEKGTGKFLFA